LQPEQARLTQHSPVLVVDPHGQPRGYLQFSFGPLDHWMGSAPKRRMIRSHPKNGKTQVT
jgi:hypothetical protein